MNSSMRNIITVLNGGKDGPRIAEMTLRYDV